MNERIRAALLLMIVLVITFVGALTYRHSFSQALTIHPGNQRPILTQFRNERGAIFATDGTILATNKATNRSYRRTYPQGAAFAAVTGYFDPVRGRSGLEAGWENWLGDRAHFTTTDEWLASVVNGQSRGSDLTLTLDPDLQVLAANLLDNRRGSIVAIDPRTGAIRALATNPTFDPNMVSGEWDRIASGKGLLVNRGLQGLYPPGSIFKIITTAAALEAGVASPASIYDGPAELAVDGSKVTNFAGKAAGKLTIDEAFTKSTNTIFAQLGLELGNDRLAAAARKFGIGAKIPFDLPVKTSTMASPASMDEVMLAWSAVGQGETLVTPLEMALVTAAIAQQGVIYKPFVVEFVRDYEGSVRYRHRPRVWRRAIEADTAASIKKMMINVVSTGTGRAAAINGVTVAGKTGTAEVGGDNPAHAWFVGFAPAHDPKLAVAVLIENGGSGGRAAAPLAKAMMEGALR